MNPGKAAALERPPAIVLGGGPDALGVFRSLGRKGVKVVAVHADAGDAALLSKYCVPAVPPFDPAAGEDAYVDFLMNLPSLGTSSAVLLPAGDGEMALVARHRARLQSRFLIARREGESPYLAYLEALGEKPGRAAPGRPQAGGYFALDDLRPFALRSGAALLARTLGRERTRGLLGGARRRAIRAGYYTGVLGAIGRLRRKKNPRLVILLYHSVGGSERVPPVLSVTKKNFAGQLRYLRRHFELISLARAVERIESGEPPPHDMAAVTFDDGFRDNYVSAFPILQQYGCPAAIFVATGPIAGGKALWPMQLFWWFKNSRAGRIELPPEKSRGGAPRPFELRTDRERRAALTAAERLLCRAGLSERDRLLAEFAEKLGFAPDHGPSAGPAMLTWADLKEMSDAGVTIGSHTVSHPSLPALSRSDALGELVESRARLEGELGRPVKFFAYPFGELGHFNAEIQSLVSEAGYEAACTAVRGTNGPGTDRLALHRVGVLDDPPAVFAFKLAGIR